MKTAPRRLFYVYYQVYLKSGCTSGYFSFSVQPEGIIPEKMQKNQEYIQRQLQEDALEDQMSLKEYIDPFTDEPVNKGNLLFASETIILANLLLAQFSSKNCRTSLQNCSGLSIKGVCPALSITTNFLEFAEIL